MREVSHRWENPFSFVFPDFTTSTYGEQPFRACVHMIPGQLIVSGRLTDPGVNFALVHGLTSVTVHINFSLPRGNFKRRVTCSGWPQTWKTWKTWKTQGIWKIVKISGKTQGNLNFYRKNLENSEKMKLCDMVTNKNAFHRSSFS